MSDPKLQGKICPTHGVPATACGGVHDESSWCRGHDTPSVVCVWRHCPSCGASEREPDYKADVICQHPFHAASPDHQYSQMMSREGFGADAGGEADPLVQEPNQ